MPNSMMHVVLDVEEASVGTVFRLLAGIAKIRRVEPCTEVQRQSAAPPKLKVVSEDGKRVCSADIARDLPSPCPFEKVQRAYIEEALSWSKKPPSYWTEIEKAGELTPYRKPNRGYGSAGTIYYAMRDADGFILRKGGGVESHG